MADPLTRTYRARYSLGGVGENAPLGATVTVELAGDNANEAVQQYEIPIGALYDTGTGTSVWVINPRHIVLITQTDRSCEARQRDRVGQQRPQVR